MMSRPTDTRPSLASTLEQFPNSVLVAVVLEDLLLCAFGTRRGIVVTCPCACCVRWHRLRAVVNIGALLDERIVIGVALVLLQRRVHHNAIWALG